MFLLIIGVFCFVFYSALTEIKEKGDNNRKSENFLTEEEKILKKLSIEEKIGQLFMIGFEGTALTSEIKDLFKVVRPGGVILFSRNIQDANQLKKLIRDLQNLSLEENGLPLLVAVDQEGGVVRRIQWLEDKISQAEIKNTDQALQIGLERGAGLRELGINLNLAPVLDVTQQSDFLHNRSFQKNPEETGELGKGLISGQKEAGILTAVKHFPGYGGISFNPETIKLPFLLKIPEIFQFQKAAEAEPELIMTANVVYSEIDEKLPFTLSPKGIQFLKEKIKGDYLIISDDLSSKVLKDNFSLENSVILAKKAGVDILLVAGGNQEQDQLKVFNALLQTVEKREINEKQINDSVLKIIKLKQKISQQQSVSESDFILSEDSLFETKEAMLSVSEKTVHLPILMYHHINYLSSNTSKEWRDLTVSPATFEEQMKYLFEQNYQPITFKKFIDYFNKGEKIPEKTLIITFDDGWRNQYNYAFPVLKKYNFPATFFVVVNYVGASKFMSWEQLKELIANGMEIGSHSMNHPNLRNLPEENLKYEIQNSKIILEKNLKQTINVFSYPYCVFDSKIIKIVQESNYLAARSCGDRRIHGLDQSLKNVYNLKSVQVYDNLYQFLKIFPPEE